VRQQLLGVGAGAVVEVEGERHRRGQLGQGALQSAAVAGVGQAEPGDEPQVGVVRPEQRDALVAATEHPVARDVTDDGVGAPSGQDAQPARVDAFGGQGAGHELTALVGTDRADVSRRSAGPSRVDCDVDTVAAGEHQAEIDVAVDHVVPDGDQRHQYSTFHM
jgi:hypothetical protein